MAPRRPTPIRRNLPRGFLPWLSTLSLYARRKPRSLLRPKPETGGCFSGSGSCDLTKDLNVPCREPWDHLFAVKKELNHRMSFFVVVLDESERAVV